MAIKTNPTETGKVTTSDKCGWKSSSCFAFWLQEEQVFQHTSKTIYLYLSDSGLSASTPTECEGNCSCGPDVCPLQVVGANLHQIRNSALFLNSRHSLLRFLPYAHTTFWHIFILIGGFFKRKTHKHFHYNPLQTACFLGGGGESFALRFRELRLIRLGTHPGGNCIHYLNAGGEYRRAVLPLRLAIYKR